MSNINNSLEYIRSRALTPADFVAECENRFANIIGNIAERIAKSGRTEIVMLAGPSSAGKTTTAKKLSEALLERGVGSYTVSLDDFYLNNDDAPLFPDGTPDFETVNALDIPFFEKTMRKLIETGEGELPEFDFVEGKRKAELKKLSITDTDVIIVEGLHALNPVITEHLPQERLLKIYINLSSRIYDAKGEIILNKRNMRFIRRLVRDYKFRGNSVEKTFAMWIKVRYGEDTYLFPYRDNADIKINTIHLYETCVLKDTAVKLLSALPKESPFYGESQRLIMSLNKFPRIERCEVPSNSLMREFIGQEKTED